MNIRKILNCLIALILCGAFLTVSGFAQTRYVLHPSSSKIQCSVRYTLVGKYEPFFKQFAGEVVFDKAHLDKSYVLLKLNMGSIESKFPLLDKAARSARLLNTAKFPQGVFESESIRKVKDGYEVTGRLTLHGITKRMTFPFSINGPDQNGQMTASGIWTVNRKDFGIVWDEHLDKGGVVVADQITINWKVVGKQGS